MKYSIPFGLSLQLLIGLCLQNTPHNAQASSLLQTQAPDAAEQVQQAFTEIVTADKKPFQLAKSEAANPKALLAKTFGKKMLARVQTVHSREIRIQKTGQPSAQHLGILTLTYASAADAKAAFGPLQKKKSGHLDHTKILTRYQWLQSGTSLLLLYSETMINDQVDHFFAQYATK